MRKKGHEKHENHERWLVSYADFITLLFAFFVVMYAVSSVNEGKYRVVSDSLALAFRAAAISIQPVQIGGLAGRAPSQPDFGRPQAAQVIAPDLRPMPTAIIQRTPQQLFMIDQQRPNATEESPSTNPGLTKNNQPRVAEPRASDPLDQVIERLRESLPELIQARLIQIRRNKNSVEIEITNNILFASGSAVINEQALAAISEIATILRDINNYIRVEGFTDDVPIRTPIYPSNWELSAARAASVVHLLMQYGVRPERMAAIGYAEYQPISENSTEQGRMRNRRVVLVILGDRSERQRGDEPAPAAPENSKVEPKSDKPEQSPHE